LNGPAIQEREETMINRRDFGKISLALKNFVRQQKGLFQQYLANNGPSSERRVRQL
jgi:hypothetical protein